MKKLLMTTTAIIMLGFAPGAYALSELCTQALEKAPISSHYVQKILDRASDGIAFVQDESEHPKNPDWTLYMGDWSLSIGAAFTQLLDAELRFNVQVENLPEHTACLRFDLLLIECKMDDVRDAMNAQIKEGHSWVAIQRLQELLRFLNERYRHLAAGALDPTYVDPGWGQRYGFDRPTQTWCCPESTPGNTCEEKSEEQCLIDGGKSFEGLDQCLAYGCVAPADIPEEESTMCPYNADYASPFPSGFGCDVETLEALQDFSTIRDEYESLKLIQEQADEFRDSAQEFLEIQQKIDALFGNDSSLPPPPPDRTHLEAFGCGWEGGYCTQKTDMRCMIDADCNEGRDDGDDACVMPDGRCEHNRAIRCSVSAQCGFDGGECKKGDEAAAPSAYPLHSPFSADKNQLGILQSFYDARAAQGYSREFADDLKTSSEFAPGKENERDNRALAEKSIPMRSFRSSLRLLFQTWGRTQGGEEVIFTAAMDPQLEVAESLTQLRSAVRDIATLASDKDGLRRFVERFAWFLRRTCMERPCNLVLEQIIKITQVDECFPYTKGDYLDDTADDPRWEKCRSAADIDLK